MDVHLRSTTVCALDAETGEAVARRFRGNPWGEVAATAAELVRWLWALGTMCREAGE